MKIERTNKSNEAVSVVTVDGEPAFTMGCQHTMLGLLGSGRNSIYRNAHYGDDYLIRDAPGGVIVGRWFVERYGWKRFWPPGATLSRVERLVRVLRDRAERAQRDLATLSAEVVADASLPRKHFVWGRTKEKDVEVLVCGLNRWGNEIEYAVAVDGKGGYAVGGKERGIARSAIGDRYARAADRAQAAWLQYGRFKQVFCDVVRERLLLDGKSVGVHRLAVDGRVYWFRIFRERDRYGGEQQKVESLDEYGTAQVTETVVEK